MIENTRAVNQNCYFVPSSSEENVQYFVDMDMLTCTCGVGRNGAPCKHQYIIWLHLQKQGSAFLPYLSATERREYSFLAIGDYLPDNYYESLHEISSSLEPLEFDPDRNDSESTPNISTTTRQTPNESNHLGNLYSFILISPLGVKWGTGGYFGKKCCCIKKYFLNLSSCFIF